MRVIVSVKINDGIVMASDSASTFTNSQVYEHAEKIVNLVKGPANRRDGDWRRRDWQRIIDHPAQGSAKAIGDKHDGVRRSSVLYHDGRFAACCLSTAMMVLAEVK